MRILGKAIPLFSLLALLSSSTIVQAKLGAPTAAATKSETVEADIKTEEDLIVKIIRDEVVKKQQQADALPQLKLVRPDSWKGNGQRERQLANLHSYGGQPDSMYIPLKECEGDCDVDQDCAYGLVCFQRDAGDPVPGCGGHDESRNDYCIRDPNIVATVTASPTTTLPVPAPTTLAPVIETVPPITTPPVPAPTLPAIVPTTLGRTEGVTPPSLAYTNKEVGLVGNNGVPDDRFPLGLCEGDCDADNECGPGLVCFLREDYEAVPGCLGGESDGSRTDYCIADPNQTQIQTQPPVTAPTYQGTTIDGNLDMAFPTMPNPTSPPPTLPVPTQPPPTLPVPTEPPPTLPAPTEPAPTLPAPTEPAPTQPAPTEPAPTLSGLLARDEPIAVEVVGKFYYPPEVYPLGLCKGDCDINEDCAAGLICFQRERYQSVPGCLGGEQDWTLSDYCIMDPNKTPATTELTTKSPTLRPIDPPTYSPVQQPTGTPTGPPIPSVVETPPPAWPPTELPTRPPTLYLSSSGQVYTQSPIWGPLPTAPPTTRSSTESPTLSNSTIARLNEPDETISPTSTPPSTPTTRAPSPSPTPRPIPEPYHNTRIRLYWEEGYYWQNSYKETFWCMMYDYRGKPGTGLCWRNGTREACSQEEMYVATCGTDDRQQFSIIFQSPEIVMIKTASDTRCFQRDGIKIVLRECDPTNDLQRWYSARGAFFQRRFEISSPSLTDHCTTMQHHPKSGEVVYLEICEMPRHHLFETNYWERW